MEEEYDDVDDDQPRVVYVDREREGRMARYATAGGDASEDERARRALASADAASHHAAGPGPGPGGAPWASDDEAVGAPPPLEMNDDDEDYLDVVP